MCIHKHQSALLWLMLVSCAAILLLFSPNLSAQCQMCRTALTQSAEGQRWSRGINAGIMLLLAAPFLIAGSILAVIYHAYLAAALRRIRARFIPGSTYRKTELTLPPA